MSEMAAVAQLRSGRHDLSLQPKTLTLAPEFAALALLECALEIGVYALRAEHPTLDDLCEVGLEPVTVRRARNVLALIHPLRRAVHRYRVSVVAAWRAADEKDDDDDLPF